MKPIACLASLLLAFSAPAFAEPPKPAAPASKPAKPPAPPTPAKAPEPAKPVTFGAPEPLSILSGGKTNAFQVEVADTPPKTAQGLAGRTDLAKDHGMLFDFRANKQEAVMTMKGVTIALDVLFIENDGTVSGIAESARPGSWRKLSPGFPFGFALAIKGGLVKELGLKPGDKVQHKLIHVTTANG